MPTRLEVLLAQIDPSRTLDEVAARVNRARNSFRFERALITDYEEYEELIGRFFAHVEAQVLRIRPMYDTGAQLYRGRATALLNQAYGSQGWKTAFEMVRTGLEGGLSAVLGAMAEALALEYARNEIRARVYDYWQGLSARERLAATEEYLAKFGHLLPSELTEGSAARLKANFPGLLIEHPFMMRRMRRLGR